MMREFSSLKLMFIFVVCCVICSCSAGNSSSNASDSATGNFLIVGESTTIANYNVITNKVTDYIIESSTSLLESGSFFDAEYISNNNLIAAGTYGITLFSLHNGNLKFESYVIDACIEECIFNRIIKANGKLYSTGYALFVPVIFSSIDGKSWDLAFPPKNEVPIGVMYGIVYGNHKFVAIGDQDFLEHHPFLLTSITGESWNPQANNYLFLDITYGDGKFVEVGDEGRVATSIDGESWIIESSVTDSKLVRVAYGDGKFIAVGEHGSVITSKDAKLWMSESSNTINNLKSIAYGYNQFVAVGESGTIITSTDGKIWKKLPNLSSQNVNYNGVKYTNSVLNKN